jgi:hypothetical protein
MSRRESNLIGEIERGALDSSVSLADTLRKCVALGGQTRSTELRDWASRELNGYKPQDELPEWRKVTAPLQIDGIKGNFTLRAKRSVVGNSRISPRTTSRRRSPCSRASVSWSDDP